MIEETLRKLSTMKLHAMASVAKEMAENARLSQIDPVEMVTTMVEAEYDKRNKNKVTRLRNKAKIKLSSACIQNITFSHKRNLKKEQLFDVISGNFLEHNHNILISGKTGTGKTFLSCAVANLACVNGYTTQYLRVSKFLEQMAAEQACGNYLKAIEKSNKIKLLVLDDLGPDVMTKNQRNIFLDIIEERYLTTATVISSQLPIEQWYHVFGEETVADAICDRIFHNAHKINLKGESLRKNSQ